MPPLDRPNLLLIVTDQQHHRMLNCAGNPWLRTPNLDSLAAGGTRFTRTYCTNPVCVPSRFSLYTGRMPGEIGLKTNRFVEVGPIPPAITESGMGWLLRQAGYEVYYGGKGHLPRLQPSDLGFGEPFTSDEREGLARACASILERPQTKPFLLVANFINPHDICYHRLTDFHYSEFARRIFDQGGIEFDLVAQLARPPTGISAEEFHARLCPPLPFNFAPQFDEPACVARRVGDPGFPIPRTHWEERQWRLHRWIYARLTEIVDREIGIVLDALEASGRTRDTVVIFTSDHGDMDGSHRLEGKAQFYDEAVRVPLIVRDPAAPRRGVVDEVTPVSNGLDLLPTLCDYAGIPAPAALTGRSLRPALHGPAPSRSDRALPVESQHGRMLVYRNFKYIRFHHVGCTDEQLFDLAEDPGESRDLGRFAAYAPVLAEMRRRFDHEFTTRPWPHADILPE